MFTQEDLINGKITKRDYLNQFVNCNLRIITGAFIGQRSHDKEYIQSIDDNRWSILADTFRDSPQLIQRLEIAGQDWNPAFAISLAKQVAWSNREEIQNKVKLMKSNPPTKSKH